MFAKEGYPFFIFFAVLLAIVIILPKTVMIIAAAFLLAVMIWFFRDPERLTPHDADAIISAADGKIVEISVQEIDGVKYHKVSVFMNLLSVHVNRAPFDGKIAMVKHIEGGFIAASKAEASSQNERCEIHFDTKFGRMIAVQVAGLVARRAVPYVKEGQDICKGDRIGMIKFSSRVDHYLPENAEVKVALGDKVTAGISTIATIK